MVLVELRLDGRCCTWRWSVPFTMTTAGFEPYWTEMVSSAMFSRCKLVGDGGNELERRRGRPWGTMELVGGLD